MVPTTLLVLPAEIVCEIARYLAPEEEYPSLNNFTVTCKRIREVCLPVSTMIIGVLL